MNGNSRDVVVNTLNRLSASGFRNKFHVTVQDEVRAALEEYDSTLAYKFYTHLNTGRFTKLVNEVFDGDRSVLDLYNRVENEANGPGSFQMPSWGIHGT